MSWVKSESELREGDNVLQAWSWKGGLFHLWIYEGVGGDWHASLDTDQVGPREQDLLARILDVAQEEARLWAVGLISKTLDELTMGGDEIRFSQITTGENGTFGLTREGVVYCYQERRRLEFDTIFWKRLPMVTK